jgi:NADPH-dependent glutamate synthase beta subunit-like oxidoreductase/dihydroorotate dehydrogenase
MAARVGAPSDYQRSAGLILARNPLGGVCGAVCPDHHCQAACVRAGFDVPIEIPSVQETVIRKARAFGLPPQFEEAAEDNGKRVAVIGAGPAGLAAAFNLAQLGYQVEIFEASDRPGGACHLIPEHRLDPRVLEADLDFILSPSRIQLHLESPIDDPAALEGFDAVLVTVGLTNPISLGIPGEEAAISGWDYLSRPEDFDLPGAVAVVGGGAVACDAATTARERGAERVEMFALEKLSEMPLDKRERQSLFDFGIQVNGRVRVAAIHTEDGQITGLDSLRVAFPPGDRPFAEAVPAFNPRGVEDVPGTEQHRGDIRHVVVAIGHRPSLRAGEGIFVAGDCETGPSTVVEAVAGGKNAADEIHAHLSKADWEEPANVRMSRSTIPGYAQVPVSLEADFFGRPIRSPFLLSAAPPTDGYEQMKRAFEAGWAGGIMKTAFDALPIHIPSEYMFSFGARTWGNCDNVSGHALERVCGEVERLVTEFPDHLTVGSTGGPVTGDAEADAAAWQSNTRKLESAGVMGIEYSLSCPQGGDGTEGDIVAQSAAKTAEIIGWILESGDPEVPKLFKLTAAVTSVEAILFAVRETLGRYPHAKAGVTLANSFPAVGFRPSQGKTWDEGIVVGLSGEGIVPISNMSLVKVAGLGVTVSGNGGPMDYKAAADFLALGAKTVQFCTLAMKFGLGVVDEMHAGLAHLMRARGIGSVQELIGIALPEPVTDFMDLTAQKKISACYTDLCVQCGNCARCSYFAIALGSDGLPVTDPELCVGCSICAKKCVSGALFMRERTPEELAVLREH